MALIEYVTEENATGDAREYYDARAEGSGRYSEISDQKPQSLFNGLLMNNPEVAAAKREYSNQLFEHGILEKDDYEIIMVAVAQANRCDYCAGSHRENLELLLDKDAETITAIAEQDFSVLPKREQIIAEFATQCINDPHRINESDIERLYDIGFEDPDIIQLLAIIGKCSTNNLIVNALNGHLADLDREFKY